jgi:hypothetical protein
VRFAVSGFNLTNHFNALDVHRNIDDPQLARFSAISAGAPGWISTCSSDLQI